MSSAAIIATLVNGENRRSISLFDRGLSYGDGIFETLRVRSGEPCLCHRHLQRLKKGCETLAIDVNLDKLEHEVKTLCSQIRDNAVLKIIITRGESIQSYRAVRHAEATRILSLLHRRPEPQTYLRQGVTVKICRHRLSPAPRLAGIKHLNRLDQVLARSEWEDEYQEGLMFDERGRAIEGTMSNLFISRGGKLLTPLLDICGVAGVMRGYLMDALSGLGLEVSETDMKLDDLLRSDGVFLTNSLIGVWPVHRIERHILPRPPRIREIRALAEQA